MRVRQRGDDLGLTVKAFAELGIGGERLGQDLDRDGAIEPRVAGFVNLSHAASANSRPDFVLAESRSAGDRHREDLSTLTSKFTKPCAFIARSLARGHATPELVL